MVKAATWGVMAAACLLLTACGTAEPSGPSKEPPKFTGVKIGKPYCIAGKWYKPALEPEYDEIGVASWYGPGFNGKSTANGEMFNQYDLTAAHPTLPMPCFVKVTNLDNGRQAMVRVNDRGPFHSDRIIDLSKAAAEKLGIVSTGTAKVRVQYLQEATDIYIASGGKVWPDEKQPASREFAQALMPRETMGHGAAQDESYYKINDEYIPAPLQVADNNGMVVESVPVLSVQSRDTMPELIKPAVADEAPFVSARELELNNTPDDAYGKEMQQVQPVQEEKPQQEAAPQSVTQSPLPAALPEQKAVETKPEIAGKMQADAATVPDQSAPVAAKAVTQQTAVIQAKPWAVQVASFAVRKNAEELMQKLSGMGQPELQPVLIDGREWFRVYLHPLASKPQDEIIASLQKIGLRDARIVQ